MTATSLLRRPGGAPLRSDLLTAAACVILLILCSAGVSGCGAQKDRYWAWGWGMYSYVPVEVVARFDWSTINFGNVSADQATVDRCNAILEHNPRHKFVIRVWPIMSLGDSMAENRFQATLFHYLYKPGVREGIEANIRAQIRLVLDGIARPENVVGLTFLEELPNHFSTGRQVLGWKRGDPMPWDVARFESAIRADLGEPYDMVQTSHRLWWGRKYAEVLGAIHQVIKDESGGRDVLYWQATGFGALDLLAPGESIFRPDIVPIHYRDIVKAGLCDGIFGYPNNEKVWKEKTMDVVNDLGCLFFSQCSTPGRMRLAPWDRTVALARERHPGNLGTFFYVEPSEGAEHRHPVPYEKPGKHLSRTDHALELAAMYLGTAAERK